MVDDSSFTIEQEIRSKSIVFSDKHPKHNKQEFQKQEKIFELFER
jgi:hypothetical protein